MSDDLFDNLGPTYDEVMDYGKKIYEKQTERRLAQVFEYQGVKYALLWDRKTGQNLRFTNYENILKEKEARKHENHITAGH